MRCFVHQCAQSMSATDKPLAVLSHFSRSRAARRNTAQRCPVDPADRREGGGPSDFDLSFHLRGRLGRVATSTFYWGQRSGNPSRVASRTLNQAISEGSFVAINSFSAVVAAEVFFLGLPQSEILGNWPAPLLSIRRIRPLLSSKNGRTCRPENSRWKSNGLDPTDYRRVILSSVSKMRLLRCSRSRRSEIHRRPH